MKKLILFQLVGVAIVGALLSVAFSAEKYNNVALMAMTYISAPAVGVVLAFAITAVIAALVRNSYGGISVLGATSIYLADLLAISFLYQLISSWR